MRRNLKPEKWLGHMEVVDIQYNYWVITHFEHSPDRKYLNHMCSENRRRVEQGRAVSLSCVDENYDLKCEHCKRVPPKQIKNAYLLMER